MERWKYYSNIVTTMALVKGFLYSLFFKGIHRYNFAHKVTLRGNDVFIFGKRNRFYGVTFDTSYKSTKKIKIGNENVFHKNSLVNAYGGAITLGNNNIIDRNALLNAHKGFLMIGNNVSIGTNTIIQGMGGVTIGDGSMIAGNVFISSSNHDFKTPNNDDYLLKEIGAHIIIGKKVWIGANTVITAGVKLGDFCIVGAGSVVTKNILSYSLAVGNPAKVIKRYDMKSEQWVLQ